MTTSRIPQSVPESLRPLFGCPKPGDQIEFKLSDPLFQAIREYHGDLASVGRYTKLLLAQDTETKDGTLSPPSIVTAKSKMVTDVLACYNQHRSDNKEGLKARIAELEEQLRRKDIALQSALTRAKSAEAALAKVTA